jgi:hypothetical protein
MLPEPIRHFLTYHGEKLASLDLKNSQPFHLSLLFTTRFWGEKACRLSLKAIQPALYTGLKRTGVLTQIRDHVRKASSSPDVQQYIQLATTGTLYEHLVATYGEQHPSMASRGEAKQQFMVFLYFNPLEKHAVRYQAYRQWAADFPNVAHLLELIKQENHTYLARLLQALEAKLLLRLVVSEFVRQYPGVFITSVHDSLLTLDSKKQELEAIIRQVYLREMQRMPEIEMKTLCPENAYHDLPKYIQKKLKQQSG